MTFRGDGGTAARKRWGEVMQCQGRELFFTSSPTGCFGFCLLLVFLVFFFEVLMQRKTSEFADCDSMREI